jgi:signal transduction histidine kinase
LIVFLCVLTLWVVRGEELLDVRVAPEPWTPDQVRAVLAGWGLPIRWWIGFFIALELVLVTATVAAGYFILRAALSWFRLYLVFVLILFATAGGNVPVVLGSLYPSLASATDLVQGVAWIALFPLAYVFPDGRFVPRWSRWLAVAWAGWLVAVVVTGSSGEGPVDGGVLLLLFASCAGAQLYRYVRVSGSTERQQTNWVMLAIALRFAFILITVATPLQRYLNQPGSRGLALYAVDMAASYLIAAALPAAIAIASVRHKLFDIDLWINRTLVYGLLTGFVVGSYALVVGGLGVLWRGTGDVVLPLLAAGLIAVGFSPVRERVQRRVNRLVYGERDDPYAVMTRLGERLGSALPPEAVLRTTVETIAQALKFPYVSVALPDGAAGTAEVGTPPPGAAPAVFPLRYQDEQVAELLVVPRPGEHLTAADRRLLDEVARQAGLAVRAASLTADLKRSRERIVTAREEERRRLHRDLHDGLGPTLASVHQRVDAAHSLVLRDPEAARRLLAEVHDQTKITIGDLRELVYTLRPPTLDELGLVAAVEEACQRLNAHPERVTIDVHASQLPPLPAVVEVAAYRISIEAVTNMIKHAAAGHCAVRLEASGSLSLSIEVTDDGCGVPPGTRPGVGMRSMRERAEEIGGTLEVLPNSPHGTVVRAELPLPTETDDQPH